MKKVLSLVLALTMILSCFTVAFAAPEDVTDENQVKAVDALMSLGIVNGYTDGSYKPGNTVTRAEMAKLLVTALGHENLAQGSETSFKDAKGTWYEGYVAMAAGLELVTGYPDGTFKGENPVSYQEAIVMTLRALGYNNAAVNNGVNAYNASKYKALGATLGLLKNVTFKNGGANRGDIAVMVFNALECETVEINEKGLAVKIEAYSYEEAVPNTNPTRFKKVVVNEILLDRSAERDDVTISTSSLDKSSKSYLGNIVDLAPYMYQNLTVYKNDDGHVLFVKRNNSTIVKGDVNAIRYTSIDWENYTENHKKVFVTKEDGSTAKLDYPHNTDGTAKAISVYYNGGETTKSLKDFQRQDKGTSSNPGINPTGGELAFAEAIFVLDSNNVITNAIVRNSQETVFVARDYKAGATTIGKVNLPKSGTKVDLSKITVTGDVTALEDIKEKDVVSFYNEKGVISTDNKVELVVTRKSIEGKISGTSASDVYFVINGDSYYSLIGDVAVGDEGTFYLDEFDQIAGFEGKSVANSNYAMMTSTKPATVINTSKSSTIDVIRNSEISFLNKEGKAVTYKIDKNAKYTVLDAKGDNIAGLKDVAVFSSDASVVPGMDDDANLSESQVKALQQFATTSSKTLKDYRNNQYVVTSYDLNDSDAVTKIVLRDLGTARTINTSSKTFVTASNVVIYSGYDSTNPTSNVNNTTVKADTFKLSAASDLPKQVSAVEYYTLTNKYGEYELIIANAQLIDNSSYAIITAVDSQLDSTNQVVRKVTGYMNGEKVDYLAANANIMSSASTDDYRAKLVRLPLSNGKISDSPVMINPTTTSSSIATVNVSKETFTITDNGASKSLADNGAIYVWEYSSTRHRYDFVRVGDISDLDRDNAEFEFFNLDPATDTSAELYEVIIIKIKR